MNNFDILICGAGISGLYCAQRILEDSIKKGQQLKVGIIESRHKTGGRIRTTKFSDFPDIAVELGAMRYLENHHFVDSIVKKYNLNTSTFNESSEPLLFLRGDFFSEKNTSEIQKIYNLREDELGKNPSQLLEFAIEKVVPKNLWGSITETGFFESDKVNESLLEQIGYETGFKDFLIDVVSNDAYELIKDGSGYDSSFYDWNAKEAIKHIVTDFLMSPKASKINDGYEALPKALEFDICNMGGKFFFNSTLEHFDTISSSNGESIKCLINNTNSKEFHEIHTTKLVLALPQESLLQLKKKSPLLNTEHVSKLLHSVTPQPAIKILFSYKDAWWKKINFPQDQVITDIPLRKVYYCLHETPDTKDPGGVLLAVYADMENFHFWDQFMPEDHKEESPAPQEMQDVITSMLRRIHATEIPDPIDSKVMRWSPSQGGAAFHAWRPGVNAEHVMKEISKPIKGKSVFVCGEAYSKYQCWVEGALTSAETMLNKHFQIM